MKPGRNDPCPCGSGKKYGECCQEWYESATPKFIAPTTAECKKLDALFDAGLFLELESQTRLLLKQYPKSGYAWKLLGASLQMQDKDCLSALQKAMEFLPHDVDVRINIGVAFSELGRLEEAEASCRRALQLKLDSAEGHNILGNVLEDFGKFDEAMASFRRALELKPNLVDARNKQADILQMQGRFTEAREFIHHNVLRDVATQNPQGNTHRETATPITALMPVGRSGSMFFHSLFDGHPELATLPGVYFKGWFGQDVWERFAPNPADPGWRELLVGNITTEFQPLFDACSRKNVMGQPFGRADWLAKYCGFMNMGAGCSQPFVVDQSAFASALLSLLAPLSTVSQKVCFELIHRAFELAIRRNTAAGSREGGQIFYHIHNPTTSELAHFLHHYPHARLLYIVRNPVQGMESWMLSGMESWPFGDAVETNALLLQWSKAVGFAKIMFKQIQSPLNTLAHSRGVRLEDVKRDAKRVMPQIAAWMGISNHPALYEASFCGLQYWGPASNVTGNITGFDTKAIDQPVGRLLGLRDIKIFETLFWPFSHLYGYTNLGKDGFRRQLSEIRPWLDEPLEFEVKLYAKLPDHTLALKELSLYKRLHSLLHQTWAVLDRDGTYHGMALPLELD